MSLPATLAAAGWYWGGLFLVYSALITLETSLILGKICLGNSEYCTYPAIVAATSESIFKRNQWCGDDGAWGRKVTF